MASRGARNTSAIVAATVKSKAGRARKKQANGECDFLTQHQARTHGGMSKDSLFALLRIDRFFQALDLCSHPFELSEVSLDFVSTVLQRGQLV